MASSCFYGFEMVKLSLAGKNVSGVYFNDNSVLFSAQN